MCSSEKVSCHGETISTPEYDPQGWYPVSVPQTVVGGLVENRVYEDPYYGLNMKKIPGYKHGRSIHFSIYHMPDDSPFRKTWWYRTEWTLDKKDQGRRFLLQINGINYSAQVWVNGMRVAGADYVTGAYRRFEIDITGAVSFEKSNCIALEITPPLPDDLSLTFIDWSPAPPDDSMGIWQQIGVYNTGPVSLNHPFVRSKLASGTQDTASLCIKTDLENSSGEPVHGILQCAIDDITIQKKITIPGHATLPYTLLPKEFGELLLKKPRIWWPYQLGTPELYTARLSFLTEGIVSDHQEIRFGIRDIQSHITGQEVRIFTVNGKDLLIRGAAWAPDLMFRQSKQRDEADIAFVKNCNLNAIRFEGNLGSDYFWDLCDKEGILVLAGWPCCNHWEDWNHWKPGDMIIARESLASQLARLRNHPSLIAWFYGSDFPPPEPVERMYLEILGDLCPDIPAVSNASAKPSKLRGATGVKMSGPYNYVPPVYWYTDTMPGYAEGFNTETCPEVCVPVIESIRKFIPPDDFSQTSASWNHHAGLAMFTDTGVVNEAIEKRFGKPANLEEHASCAQVLGYECWRAMYEAYGRNFPKGTGVIGWMLNSSWPSVFWQLYDYYLEPTGAFFGAKKACEPLHIQYSYDDRSIWVVNTTLKPCTTLTAGIKMYSDESTPLSDNSLTVSVDALSRIKIHSLQETDSPSPVYFLFLSLKQEDSVISRNCYWLSKTPDVFIDRKQLQTRFYWPVEKHADFSLLKTLPKAAVDYTYEILQQDDRCAVRVTVSNNSPFCAFFLKAVLLDKKSKKRLAPLLWDDNCVTLQPQESIMLRGSFSRGLYRKNLAVTVEGWNI